MIQRYGFVNVAARKKRERRKRLKALYVGLIRDFFSFALFRRR